MIALIYVRKCSAFVVLALVGLLLAVAPAGAEDRERVDLYGADSRRQASAIVDRESGRVDYYDKAGKRTGYGTVDETGRAERFDRQGRRQPATVLPPAPNGRR